MSKLFEGIIQARHQAMFNPSFLRETFSYYNWRDVPVRYSVEQEGEDLLFRISPVKGETPWQNPFDPLGLLEGAEEEEDEESEEGEEGKRTG